MAKEYGRYVKKEFETVIYLYYTDTLYQTISRMQFIDDTPYMSDEELFHSHFAFFQNLNERVLVILDNFNMLPEQDELFQDFLSLSFHLLVTTRNKIEDVPYFSVNEIESMEDLTELFYAYAPKSKSEPSTVENIIQTVYKHTLTVELAAKTLNAADLTPNELLIELQKDSLMTSNPNKIRLTKDGRIKKARPYQHIEMLFQLQHLSEGHQFILQHMLLMLEEGISKKLFQRWLGDSDFNCINEMIDYGWIKEDDLTGRVSMHPFVHEVITGFDRPSFTKCRAFIERLGQEFVVEVEDEIYYRDLLNLTKGMFKSLVIDDSSLAFQLLENLLIYLDKYVYLKTMKDILAIMEFAIPMGSDHRLETATFEFYLGVIALNTTGFEIGDNHFQKALAYIKPFDKHTAKRAINWYQELSMYYFCILDLVKYQEYSKKVVSLSKQYGYTDSIDYDFANVNQMLGTCMNNENPPKDIESILESPEMKSFASRIIESDRFKFTNDEFREHVEKMQPDEMLDADGKELFQKIKEGLETVESRRTNYS